jgi:7-carboxy-7-deazaguanine synthase
MEDTAVLTAAREKQFLLSELYLTIQGESSLVGLPTIFVRLYSCNLRCRWCDSMHAVEGGNFTRIPIEDVVRRIQDIAGASDGPYEGVRNICWTGGEPLLQGNSIAHVLGKLPKRFVHSIETDGEVDLRTFDTLAGEARRAGRVRYIMDIKCPGSSMVASKAFANLPLLQEQDEVKFVLLDRADYEFAKDVLHQHPTKAGTVLFSPVNPANKVAKGLDSCQLAGWILRDRLPVRLQIQLHKVLWPGKERGI